MNILVLGGSYFIGKILVELLVHLGINVTVLNRGTKRICYDRVTLIVADRHNKSELENRLHRKKFDAVIDLSGYDSSDVSTILNITGNNISQYIFCSSIAVCRQPPIYWPISEEHQKCSSILENKYGYNKLCAEEYLFEYSLKSNLSITIVRPTYVYGPYDYSGRFDYFFTSIINDQQIIIPGNGFNIIQFGYVYDLCKAIIAMIGNSQAFGQVFNISGCEYVTTRQLINLISSVLKKETSVIFDSSGLVGDQEKSTITSENRFSDISKAEKVLGIVPETSLSEGIKKTYESWLKNKELA